jgi:hypothetical protein
MKKNKVLSELNSVFNIKRLIKAVAVETYQNPHYYYPNAELLNGKKPKELSIHDIRHYENEHGPSCDHKDIVTREPCKLRAEEHEMKKGVVVFLKQGTTQEQLIDEICSVVKILEKHNISGISQTTEE